MVSFAGSWAGGASQASAASVTTSRRELVVEREAASSHRHLKIQRPFALPSDASIRRVTGSSHLQVTLLRFTMKCDSQLVNINLSLGQSFLFSLSFSLALSRFLLPLTNLAGSRMLVYFPISFIDQLDNLNHLAIWAIVQVIWHL